MPGQSRLLAHEGHEIADRFERVCAPGRDANSGESFFFYLFFFLFLSLFIDINNLKTKYTLCHNFFFYLFSYLPRIKFF